MRYGALYKQYVNKYVVCFRRSSIVELQVLHSGPNSGSFEGPVRWPRDPWAPWRIGFGQYLAIFGWKGAFFFWPDVKCKPCTLLFVCTIRLLRCFLCGLRLRESQLPYDFAGVCNYFYIPMIFEKASIKLQQLFFFNDLLDTKLRLYVFSQNQSN